MLRTNIKYNYIQINSNNFLQIIKIRHVNSRMKKIFHKSSTI